MGCFAVKVNARGQRIAKRSDQPRSLAVEFDNGGENPRKSPPLVKAEYTYK